MNKNIKKDMNKPGGRTINTKSNKTFKSDITKSNYKETFAQKEKEKYFRCYSVKLNAFLKEHNLKTIKETRHPKTNKIAFIYEKNAKLDELLTIWTNNKGENVLN